MSRVQLKSYFETGKYPTEANFSEFIDATVLTTDYPQFSVLVANSVGSPEPLLIGTNQVVGRLQGDFVGIDIDELRYTDEQAQNAVAQILTDSATISFDYAPSTILAHVKSQMSIDSDGLGIKLVNDQASPGISQYYGTSAGGEKGWHDLNEACLSSVVSALSDEFSYTQGGSITLNYDNGRSANSVQKGYLSPSDWVAFNSKFSLPPLQQGGVLYATGSTIAEDSSNFFWDANSKFLSLGDKNPQATLHLGYSKTVELSCKGAINCPSGGIGWGGNLLLRSEAFDHSVWTKHNCSVFANSEADPLNANTADRIVGVDASSAISQQVSNSATGQFTFSVYLRALSGTTTISIKIDSSAETGTLKTLEVTSEWKRYSVTQTFTSANTSKTCVLLIGASTIVAWGACLTATASAGVYIQTTASQVSEGYWVALRAAPGFCLLSTAAGNNNLSVQGLSVSGSISCGLITASVTTAASSVDGAVCENPTAASSGVPVRLSPRVRFTGRGWSGVNSQALDFIQEVRPTGGTNPIGGSLVFASQVAGGGFSDLLSISEVGRISIRPGRATGLLCKLPNGVIYQQVTDSPPLINGQETILCSYSVPSNILSIDGDGVTGFYVGILKSSTSSKRLRAYFGGSIIFDSGNLVITGGDCIYQLKISITKSGSVAKAFVCLLATCTSTSYQSDYVELTGLDFSTSLLLSVTGTNSGAGQAVDDIVNKVARVVYEAGA